MDFIILETVWSCQMFYDKISVVATDVRHEEYNRRNLHEAIISTSNLMSLIYFTISSFKIPVLQNIITDTAINSILF